jgi:hypothetical protein
MYFPSRLSESIRLDSYYQVRTLSITVAHAARQTSIILTTRSNSACAIGFMKSPERLNVLLSRARDGLILIGNMDTF